MPARDPHRKVSADPFRRSKLINRSKRSVIVLLEWTGSCYLTRFKIMRFLFNLVHDTNLLFESPVQNDHLKHIALKLVGFKRPRDYNRRTMAQ